MTNPTNRDWLALHDDEDVLEPDLPICDPHHHLWDKRYERTTPRYLLADMMEDLDSGHNIVSTVFIECGAMFRADGPKAMAPVGETEFVNGIAAMSASGLYGDCRVAAGIVAHADLMLGADVVPVLDAHEVAAGGRLRGFRHGLAVDREGAAPGAVRNNPMEDQMMDSTFRAGFAELGKRNLSFEIWCYHPQLPYLNDLARAFPDSVIILDHFGGPLGVGPWADKKDEVFEFWKDQIDQLSQCPNVYAKLGGINMIENGFGWQDNPKPPTSEELMQATRHYYEYTLEKFGIDRCMFESNFPVDQVTCSYKVLWNSFKRLTAGYSADEKAKLYHDVACKVYRL